MTEIERSIERDTALLALMAADPFPGWNLGGLRRVAGEHADLLFLGGATELIEASVDLADRRMEKSALELSMEDWRTGERVRAVIALRLQQNRPFRVAIGRAIAVAAFPAHSPMAARATARTVDAIWHAAGDRATDFSWYTKRATLGPIYVATLACWLRDASGDDEAALEFLDRRLAQVSTMGKLRKRLFRRLCFGVQNGPPSLTMS